MAKPHTLKTAIGYDDIDLLPNFSRIESRDEVSLDCRLSRNIMLKYPFILSPMDTVSCEESCVALNKMGAAGILHRFMSFEERIEIAKNIRAKSGSCYVAVGLNDNIEDLKKLSYFADLFFLDVAHGSTDDVFKWIKGIKAAKISRFSGPVPTWHNIDLITGNTLTQSSVLKHFNLGSDGIRHGIGIGGACLTTEMTGVGCPAMTAIYYAWKGLGDYRTQTGDMEPPSILVDGGIRKPSDVVKAIGAGANAVISGKMFAGCKETPGDIMVKYRHYNNSGYEDCLVTEENFWPYARVKELGRYKVYRGMASESVQKESGKEEIYVEGDEYMVPYTGKSVCDVVREYAKGLKSALSYFGFWSLSELRGAIWEDRVLAVRKTPNTVYEGSAHGK